MPPRYAYWTILVDDQPTAFRSAMQDDLQPTFKRLKAKHPSARMVWFQNGKVWNSRLDAQEAMRARGEMGRRGDARQDGGLRSRGRGDQPGPAGGRREGPGKLEWKPKNDLAARFSTGTREHPARREKLEWRPKDTRTSQLPGGSQVPKRTPQARRDKTWRPGGDHKDPRQKYKDAKKAKWTRFKHTIRKRWESKQGRKKDDE